MTEYKLYLCANCGRISRFKPRYTIAISNQDTAVGSFLLCYECGGKLTDNLNERYEKAIRRFDRAVIEINKMTEDEE